MEQSRVLGSFYWFYWSPQILGGILAARYGTKLVFGLSNFLASFLCILIPAAVNLHVNYLIVLRIVQGLVSVIFKIKSFTFLTIFNEKKNNFHKFKGCIVSSNASFGGPMDSTKRAEQIFVIIYG